VINVPSKVLVLALATLAVAAPDAAAQQTRNWFVCGGNHFDTCASVFVTVSNSADFTGRSNVELTIWNLSGTDGTYAGPVFTKVGFFPQYHASGGVIDATALGPLAMSGPTRTNKSGAGPADWKLGNPNNAGGISLDLAVNNGNGVSNGIANACAPGELPGGNNAFWLNPCAGAGFDNDPNAAGWVTINFEIDGQWDLAASELLVFGQNGPGGLSTQCITGANGNCGPTTSVPEPGTWLLLATGFGGLGLAGLRRRRGTGVEFDAAA